MPHRRTLAAALLAAALPATARAHHGWGSFDSTQPLDLTGEVVSSTYANPHGIVVIRQADRPLTFELAPVSRMRARGLAAEEIAPGRRVRILGYRNTQTPTLYRAEWIEVEGRRIPLR